MASPREPCGATWLINCFLELGILTYRKSIDNMWRREGGFAVLRSREYILKKWLPSLHHRATFTFRSDIEVEWVHEWPMRRLAEHKVIYFYRDPRDALYSRYKRESATIPFSEYLEIPEPSTLLNKVESNCLHTQCWMRHPNFRLFRFEDYKKDPEAALRDILEYIGVEATDEEIFQALAASTAEKAKEVEELLSARAVLDSGHGEVRQMVNQGGIVGRWQELDGEDRCAVMRTEALCGKMLHEFGYEVSHRDGESSDFPNHVAFVKTLDSFRQVMFYPDASQATVAGVASLENQVLCFARQLTGSLLDRSGMTRREAQNLLCSLAVFSSERNHKAFENIEQVALGIMEKEEFYFQLFKRTGQGKWLPRIGIFPMFAKLARLASLRLANSWGAIK